MKTVWKTVFTALLAVLLLVPGCGDNPEVARRNAELELATVKKDLDAMFLATKALAELGDGTAAVGLPELKQAIEIREKMKVAAADHDHEKAVVFAGDLLDRVPAHEEATRVLRESGQIFFYLEAARNSAVGFLDEEGADEPQVESVKATVAPDGLSGEELQRFWTRAAQGLLRTLNLAVGPVDGVLGPKTRAAIKSFRSKHDLPESDVVDEVLVRELEKGATEKARSDTEEQRRQEVLERRFHKLAKARQYVEKARQLDPQFKNSVELERLLEQAHTAAFYVHALSLIEFGRQATYLAALTYSYSVDALNSAASSYYGSVTGMWNRIGPVVEDIKKSSTDPLADKMKHIASLLNTYEKGEALAFVQAAQEYSLVTQRAIDAFLVPTGNLIQYREAGGRALVDFKVSMAQLEARIPNAETVKEGFDGLVKTIKSYRVYSDGRAQAAVEKNRKMFSL